MRWGFVLVALVLLTAKASAETVIVVGGCAGGDYEFNDVYDALKEAGDHRNVELILCGEGELRWGRRAETGDFEMHGGAIRSKGEYVKIVGDDVYIHDVNFAYTRIIVVASGDVVIENVWAQSEETCIDVNAGGDVSLVNVHVRNCGRGVRIRQADELNVWSVFPEDVETPLDIDVDDVRKIYFNTLERTVEIPAEKVVEVNRTVETVEYIDNPALKAELRDCENAMRAVLERKKELEMKIEQLEDEIKELKGQKTYPDPLAILGLLAIGTGIGYLAGRM